jgi:hypothetical protein
MTSETLLITGEFHCFKLYVRDVLTRILNDWIENRAVISECQMGFRKGRSKDGKICVLRTVIHKCLLWKRGEVYLIFVYLSKDFHTVVRGLALQNGAEKTINKIH